MFNPRIDIKDNKIALNQEYLKKQLDLITEWANKSTDAILLKSFSTKTLQKLHDMCNKELQARAVLEGES